MSDDITGPAIITLGLVSVSFALLAVAASHGGEADASSFDWVATPLATVLEFVSDNAPTLLALGGIPLAVIFGFKGLRWLVVNWPRKDRV